MTTASGLACCAINEVSDASAPGCDEVRGWLRDYNWEVNREFMEQLHDPQHQPRPLVLLAASSENAAVVGGLFAETQLAWLKISIMAVMPEWRSRGVGAALLAEAERFAVLRGCRHAYVDTMAHQAPGFYLKQGYQVVGELPDWDSRGHSKFFFAKHLGDHSRGV